MNPYDQLDDELNRLLPCPFCGSPAGRKPGCATVEEIGCFNPECLKPRAKSTHLHVAIARWQSRSNSKLKT